MLSYFDNLKFFFLTESRFFFFWPCWKGCWPERGRENDRERERMRIREEAKGEERRSREVERIREYISSFLVEGSVFPDTKKSALSLFSL